MRPVGKQRTLKRPEVANVLRHQSALLAPCSREHVPVRRAGEKCMTPVVNRDDVMIAHPKLSGDRGGGPSGNPRRGVRVGGRNDAGRSEAVREETPDVE